MAISRRKRTDVWEKTDGRCWYCGKQLVWPTNELARNRANVENWFVVEHIIPLCQGGEDTIGNLLPACFICNSRKHRKCLEEFRLYLSMMSIGVTAFTSDQIDYLLENGIEIPMPDPVVFWGEENEP